MRFVTKIISMSKSISSWLSQHGLMQYQWRSNNQADRTTLASIQSAHPRSPQWRKLRDATIEAHPWCAACGNRVNLVPHHIKPYHLYRELELEPTNLIVLCEGPVVNCHFLFGHVRNWRSYNPDVAELAATWYNAITMAKINQSVPIH